MGFGLIIRTILEFAVAGLILYGIYNEKKLIAFENRMIRIITKKIKRYRRRKSAAKKRANNTEMRAQHMHTVQPADNQLRRIPNYANEFVA